MYGQGREYFQLHMLCILIFHYIHPTNELHHMNYVTMHPINSAILAELLI